MAYRPSKWSSKVADTTDADGWQTVGSSGATTTSKSVPSKWGQSALKKPEPKFEDEYPTLSSRTPSSSQTSLPQQSKPLTLAERMKQKLAEEEEQKRKEEAERFKAEEDSRNRYTDDIPLHSILRARQMDIASKFKLDYNQPEYDDYYGHSGDCHADGYGASYDYDYDAHENVHEDTHDEYDQYAPSYEYDDN